MNKPVRGSILGKVLVDAFFIMLPVLVVAVIGVEKLVGSGGHHESAVIFELMLATLIFWADVVRDAVERQLCWKRYWKALRFLAIAGAILGTVAAGIWFGAGPQVHELSVAVQTGAAAIVWTAVKCRVVYSELEHRRFLIEHFKPNR